MGRLPNDHQSQRALSLDLSRWAPCASRKPGSGSTGWRGFRSRIEVGKYSCGPASQDAADDSKAVPNIPPSIANANAQMLLAGVQISAAAAIPSGTDIPAMASGNPAGTRSDNETIVVAADQLNDMDKALHESGPAPAVAANPPPSPAATMTSESSVWDQTSLIGKIFIGFGALLTMASAARMFMA
jgi:hypothetical protein